MKWANDLNDNTAKSIIQQTFDESGSDSDDSSTDDTTVEETSEQDVSGYMNDDEFFVQQAPAVSTSKQKNLGLSDLLEVTNKSLKETSKKELVCTSSFTYVDFKIRFPCKVPKQPELLNQPKM